MAFVIGTSDFGPEADLGRTVKSVARRTSTSAKADAHREGVQAGLENTPPQTVHNYQLFDLTLEKLYLFFICSLEF